MNTFDTNLGCGLVDAWEERIWLDRREAAGTPFPKRSGSLARIGGWLRRVKARSQLGPVADDAWRGDPQKWI